MKDDGRRTSETLLSPLSISVMPALFDFGARGGGHDSKMHVSQGSLPPYIDPSQPPTMKSPWRQINELSFVHSVTMLMPDELYNLVWNKINNERKTLKYSKVLMKLQEVLEGDFFTEYVRKGLSRPSTYAIQSMSFTPTSRRCLKSEPPANAAAGEDTLW